MNLLSPTEIREKRAALFGTAMPIQLEDLVSLVVIEHGNERGIRKLLEMDAPLPPRKTTFFDLEQESAAADFQILLWNSKADYFDIMLLEPLPRTKAGLGILRAEFIKNIPTLLDPFVIWKKDQGFNQKNGLTTKALLTAYQRSKADYDDEDLRIMLALHNGELGELTRNGTTIRACKIINFRRALHEMVNYAKQHQLENINIYFYDKDHPVTAAPLVRKISRLDPKKIDALFYNLKTKYFTANELKNTTPASVAAPPVSDITAVEVKAVARPTLAPAAGLENQLHFLLVVYDNPAGYQADINFNSVPMQSASTLYSLVNYARRPLPDARHLEIFLHQPGEPLKSLGHYDLDTLDKDACRKLAATLPVGKATRAAMPSSGMPVP